MAPGSLIRTCRACGVEVWVSPGGADVVAREAAYVACVVCAMRSAPEDGTEIEVVVVPSPGGLS